jgi:5-methylcytosine-specific restriction endonuclease McrA
VARKRRLYNPDDYVPVSTYNWRSQQDLSGQRFGKLLVLECVGTQNCGGRYITYLCRCDCGSVYAYHGRNLKSGNTKSCGCVSSFHSPETQRKAHEKLAQGFAVKSAKSVYDTYQRSTKKTGRVLRLAFDVVTRLTQDRCWYCGSTPEEFGAKKIPYGRGKGNTYRGVYEGETYHYNGIDRVDNEGDYTEDNVVTACYVCNRAKNSMSSTSFQKWLLNVAMAVARKLGPEEFIRTTWPELNIKIEAPPEGSAPVELPVPLTH